jgi:hypothetical protein
MPAHRFSASKSQLADHCIWWARADTPRAPYQRKQRSALVGIACHFAFAKTTELRDESCHVDELVRDEDSLTDDERETVEVTHNTWLIQWYRHQVAAGIVWTPELAIGFDPFTSTTKVVPQNGKHRDYDSLGESFVPGTTDIVRFDNATGTVYVTDWKCSNHWDLAARPAAENKQLATLALAFAYHYGAKRAIVALGIARPSGLIFDEAELTSLDLAEHHQWLTDRMDEMPRAEPVDGPHCFALYCDHYGTCPATKGALAAVAPDPVALLEDKRRLPIIDDPLSFQSPEHARYQYETLRAAQAAIESRMAACWDAVRQYADVNGGVPLPNGMVWKRTIHPRESIELGAVGATNALEYVLGPDHWKKAVEMSATKKSIESAARECAIERATKGEKITIKAVKNATLDALRAVGAVKASQTIRYEEVEKETAK